MTIREEPPYSNCLAIAAEEMGLSLFGRYDLARVAELLECEEGHVKKLISSGELRIVNLPTATIKIFGREIINYLIGDTPAEKIVEHRHAPESRLLKIWDIVFMTSISRSTIDRLEAKGEFPNRVKLGPNRIAWKESEVLLWMSQRPKKSESY